MSQSKAVKALEFLLDDMEKAKRQWREGEQFESMLQRNKYSFEKLLDEFDPQPDEDAWVQEYNASKRSGLLGLFRRRLAFLEASRKEFREEYDEDVTDVDFMRLLEVPFTDPKYAVECEKEELKD